MSNLGKAKAGWRANEALKWDRVREDPTPTNLSLAILSSLMVDRGSSPFAEDNISSAADIHIKAYDGRNKAVVTFLPADEQ